MAKRSLPKPSLIKAGARKNTSRSKTKSGVFTEPMAATRKIFQIFVHRLAVYKSKDVLILLASIYAVYANYFFLWIGKASDVESVWMPMAIFGAIAAVVISARFWVSRLTNRAITSAFLWIRLAAPFCLIPLIVLYTRQRPSTFGYISLAIGALISGVISYHSVPLLFRPSDKLG